MMRMISSEPAVAARVAVADIHVDAFGLEVYQPAVMPVVQGELRPLAGWPTFRPATSKAQSFPGSSLRGAGATSNDLGGFRIVKPRQGSHAMSGTG
jgi:hypothetical protein